MTGISFPNATSCRRASCAARAGIVWDLSIMNACRSSSLCRQEYKLDAAYDLFFSNIMQRAHTEYERSKQKVNVEWGEAGIEGR